MFEPKTHISTKQGINNASNIGGMFFQPKLAINELNDVYEQEADAVADKVMRMEAPLLSPKRGEETFFKPRDSSLSFGEGWGEAIQRKCAACEEEEEKNVRRKESSHEQKTPPSQTEDYISSLSGGKALSNKEKAFFGSGMGHDFSNVRIHDDSNANQSAKNIQALAYTSGNNIVFASNQYRPETDSGKKLLAHELTHVIQQDKTPSLNIQRSVDEDGITDTPPRYSFSTRCGWIDWSHADGGMTSQLIQTIRNASDAMKASGDTTPHPVTTPAMESHGGPFLLSSVTPSFHIKRPLSDDEILSVALRVFMLQSLAFENLQQWTDALGKSSFSAEDLPSNMISFYRAAKNFSRDDITTICDALDADSSLAEYETNEPTERNRTFRPLATSQTTGWPADLSSIRPADIDGPLMDAPTGTLNTFGGAARDINLAEYNALLSGNLSVISVTGSNTVDISSTESSSAAGNHFEIAGLPSSHNYMFRWNILDDSNNAYAMWSDSGGVHQYSAANNAYIGSGTRALFRDRSITTATVNCRIAISNAQQFNEVFRLRVNFTW